MLCIPSGFQRFCDGVSRRAFLQIGGLALGGLSMPQILRAEEQTGQKPSHKAIIMVFLTGGPPQQDTLDLKPDAPAEFRGTFQPIPTNVPGIQICEHMPHLAKVMDKAVIVRSVMDIPADDHAAYHCLTGRTRKPPAFQPAGGWPSLGSVLSKVQGPVDSSSPSFVALQRKMKVSAWSDVPSGFLGAAHAPFKPAGEGKGDMVLNGITAGRLNDRKTLLASFDRFRRQVDASKMMEGVDRFTQQALGILTSSKLCEALDLSREDESVRRRYGRGIPKLSPFSEDYYDAPGQVEDFLVARRLVEAGVRCVTVNFGKWDTHADNFRRVQNNLPLLDQGLAALIQDLHDRGLDKDVSVVVWGEMGRTPRINGGAGRDHWTKVMSVLLAGGGMPGGQVIGSTDRIAGEADDRPVRFQEVFATLYHKLGIDLENTMLTDLSGRPHYLLEHREPIRELI